LKPQSSNLAASAISGIRWNYFGAIGASLCSLAISVTLARILGPQPFGQIIIASTIYGFLNLFVDGGFSQALIQKATLTEEDIRKTFTCQVGIGFGTTAVVYFAAPWIARQFHDPSAVRVVQTMSSMIAIQSTGLVAAALLRRGMRFKAIQYSYLSSYLFGFVVIGVPLALHGEGVWSLVLAYLAQCTLNSLLLHFSTRHSVAPLFAFPDRAIATFGGTMIANNLVNWGHANLDNIAASRLGPVSLGLYGRGSNFAYQPVNAVVNGLQSVLLSSTAKVQERRALMRDLTLTVIAVVFGLLGAAYVTFAMIPDTAIIGLYGSKWLALVPMMIPLALAMPFYGAHCVLGPILCGLGRPELEFWPQAISCIFAACAFFTAVHFSLVALAWTLLIVMLIRFGMIAAFILRVLQIPWTVTLLVVARRAVFSVVFGCLAWCADHSLRILHIAATPRLAVLMVFCLALLVGSVWLAGNLVFGQQAIAFLLNYASHLPESYVRQLRRQARPEGELTLAST
jgi:lipopolysaccharide exporter